MHEDEVLIRTSWFAGHTATIEKVETEHNGPMTIIRWQRPGTGNYAMIYVMIYGTLFVQGDLGCATYRVGQFCALDFWANTDLHYFHSKCEASEGGANNKWQDWDYNQADKHLDEWFKDNKPTFENEAHHQPLAGLLAEAKSNTANKEEWISWLQSVEAHMLFGDSLYDGDLYDCGAKMPLRCRAHHVGIEMINEILKKQGE